MIRRLVALTIALALVALDAVAVNRAWIPTALGWVLLAFVWIIVWLVGQPMRVEVQ